MREDASATVASSIPQFPGTREHTIGVIKGDTRSLDIRGLYREHNPYITYSLIPYIPPVLSLSAGGLEAPQDDVAMLPSPNYAAWAFAVICFH